MKMILYMYMSTSLCMYSICIWPYACTVGLCVCVCVCVSVYVCLCAPCVQFGTNAMLSMCLALSASRTLCLQCSWKMKNSGSQENLWTTLPTSPSLYIPTLSCTLQTLHFLELSEREKDMFASGNKLKRKDVRHPQCNREKCTPTQRWHPFTHTQALSPSLSVSLSVLHTHKHTHTHTHTNTHTYTRTHTYTPMMDLYSWSQAAVLSPSQCPAQRPLVGYVDRVTTIPLFPVTFRRALH